MEESVMRFVVSINNLGMADDQDDILPAFGAGPNDLVRHFSPTKPGHLYNRREKSHQPGYRSSKP